MLTLPYPIITWSLILLHFCSDHKLLAPAQVPLRQTLRQWMYNIIHENMYVFQRVSRVQSVSSLVFCRQTSSIFSAAAADLAPFFWSISTLVPGQSSHKAKYIMWKKKYLKYVNKDKYLKKDFASVKWEHVICYFNPCLHLHTILSPVSIAVLAFVPLCHSASAVLCLPTWRLCPCGCFAAFSQTV